MGSFKGQLQQRKRNENTVIFITNRMTYDDWYIIEFPILVIESDIEHKGCDAVEERHNADKHVKFRWR